MSTSFFSLFIHAAFLRFLTIFYLKADSFRNHYPEWKPILLSDCDRDSNQRSSGSLGLYSVRGSASDRLTTQGLPSRTMCTATAITAAEREERLVPLSRHH